MPPSAVSSVAATQFTAPTIKAPRAHSVILIIHRTMLAPRASSTQTQSKPQINPNAKVQASDVPTPVPIPTDDSSSLPARTTLIVTPTWDATTAFGMTSAVSDPDLVHDPAHFTPSTTTVYVYASATSSSSSTFHPTSPLILEPSHPAHSASSVRMIGHIPFYLVVLIGVGGLGGIIAAIIILTKCCNRKRRKTFPRPSKPILQDSPLFGGKERFSRGSRNIWADPSFNSLLQSHKGDGWRPLSGGKPFFSEKGYGTGSAESPSPYLTVNYPNNNGSNSGLLSPSSIYTTAAPSTQDVGIALEFPVPPLTNLTSNVTQPLNVKNKSMVDGKAMRRRSRSSVYFSSTGASQNITVTETANAFQTPRAAPTPTLPKPVLKNSNSNGTRLPTPTRKVAPQDQPIITIQRTPSNSRRDRKEENFEYALTTVKTADRRDRDTRALTSALGLVSPTQPASCFSPVSLYPDDSLSVVHGRAGGGSGRPYSEAAPSEAPSPTGTMSNAALGNFMLTEYPSNATLASMTASGRAKDRQSFILDPFTGAPEMPALKKSGSKGTKLGNFARDDRPPRVPSPPTLPSLAQMALGNADPDYRSPTFSIYGLYEAQRKSKGISGI